MPMPASESEITAAIARLRHEIPDHVMLMAVSKGHSEAAIRTAYAAGLRHFGENRVQEAALKITNLSDLSDIHWHLIGHLQGNKARKAIQLFQVIDAVDNLSLAERLSDLAQELNTPQAIGLQLKLAPDPTKYGWELPQFWTDLPYLMTLPSLTITSLMTILPQGLTPEAATAVFQHLTTVRDRISALGYPQLTLSMGMSGDYRLAITAGSTCIRLGSAIFGDRAT